MNGKNGKIPDHTYTCNDYREEMILVALKKQLASGDLTGEERQALEQRVKELEADMGLD